MCLTVLEVVAFSSSFRAADFGIVVVNNNGTIWLSLLLDSGEVIPRIVYNLTDDIMLAKVTITR